LPEEIAWKPLRRLRAYEQVLEEIESQIRAGALKPGDRLPGERQLAEALGVSRSSIREAMRVLEALEIISARVGRGDDSGSFITSDPGRGLESLMRFQIALSRFSMDDVVETRVMVESWAVRQAASRGHADRIQDAVAILDQMESEPLTPEEFNELDIDFHASLAEAAGNRLTSYWMQALRTSIRFEMSNAFKALDDWRTTVVRLRKEHRDILDAVVAQDPDRAAALVADHISSFYFHVGITDQPDIHHHNNP
jgi:GntR family transcriptional repressor for pyruvate dehydrogenase complex